jgi:hypothetical protein
MAETATNVQDNLSFGSLCSSTSKVGKLIRTGGATKHWHGMVTKWMASKFHQQLISLLRCLYNCFIPDPVTLVSRFGVYSVGRFWQMISKNFSQSEHLSLIGLVGLVDCSVLNQRLCTNNLFTAKTTLYINAQTRPLVIAQVQSQAVDWLVYTPSIQPDRSPLRGYSPSSCHIFY